MSLTEISSGVGQGIQPNLWESSHSLYQIHSTSLTFWYSLEFFSKRETVRSQKDLLNFDTTTQFSGCWMYTFVTSHQNTCTKHMYWANLGMTLMFHCLLRPKMNSPKIYCFYTYFKLHMAFCI